MENFPQIIKALHNQYLNEPENTEKSTENGKKPKSKKKKNIYKKLQLTSY